MGQYYHAVIEAGDTEAPVVVNPMDFWDGLKLLEHALAYGQSPASSLTVACAMALLDAQGPSGSRVWWMGDYADNVIDDGDEAAWGAYRAAWGDGPSKKPSPEVEEGDCRRTCTGYLVDLDRHTFVDVAASCNGADTESHWVFHPLPLLAAVGNGQGLGDYGGPDPEGLIGSWAGHRIAWVKEPPKDASQTICVFAVEVQEPRWG